MGYDPAAASSEDLLAGRRRAASPPPSLHPIYRPFSECCTIPGPDRSLSRMLDTKYISLWRLDFVFCMPLATAVSFPETSVVSQGGGAPESQQRKKGSTSFADKKKNKRKERKKKSACWHLRQIRYITTADLI